jgi:hypothetical protein
MLYFEILPDDIIVILFKYHFKDVKYLSRVSERLKYNYEKVVSLIKSGYIEPEVWCNKVEKKDPKIVVDPFEENININAITMSGTNYQYYKSIFDILYMDNNILQIYYDDHDYDDGSLNIVYKIKSSKSLLDLLSNNNIDISKLRSDRLYFNLNCLSI